MKTATSNQFFGKLRANAFFKTIVLCLIKVHHYLMQIFTIFKGRMTFCDVTEHFGKGGRVGIAIMLATYIVEFWQLR